MCAIKAGELAPGFGESGRLVLPAPFQEWVQSMDVDPNQSVIIAGVVGGNAVNYVIGRFLPDGVPDSTFGDGGLITGGFFSGGVPNSLQVYAQADGILLTGTDVIGGASVLAAARFTLEGRPDPSFGRDGVAYYGLEDLVGPSAHRLYPSAMTAVTATGKILLAADLRYTDGDYRPIVVRLNADGSLDRTWDGKGYKVIVLEAEANVGANSLYGLHADGDKVIVSANYNGGIGVTGDKNYMARFNDDGSLDRAFATNGVFFFPANATRGEVAFDTSFPYSAAGSSQDYKVWPLLRIVSSGIASSLPRYLATGSKFSYGAPNKWAGIIAGLDDEGRYDAQFNGGEPVVVDPDVHGAYISSCIAQPGGGGKFIAVGAREDGLLLGRRLVSGAIDPTFGQSGYIIKQYEGLNRYGIFAAHAVIVEGNRLWIAFSDANDRPVIDAYTL